MIKVYNTLSNRKEPFKPLQNKNVRIYNCGVTIYNHCHLRHARAYIVFDVIRSYLKCKNFNVFYVQNITDTGDVIYDFKKEENRIEKRSKLIKMSPKILANIYINSMWRDLDSLKIARPNVAPRISKNINKIIGAIKNLISNGFAYESNGSVYFNLDKFLEERNRDFGKLSKGRVIKLFSKINSGEKHGRDFLLWKKSTKMKKYWSSPWGNGYPSWHVGCAVISMDYLGQPFDIHGGGIEHALLHHECEIAIAEGLNKRKFVNYWLHIGPLKIRGKNVSRASDNFITITKALESYTPELIRLYMLLTKYEKTINYNPEKIEKTGEILRIFIDFFQKMLRLVKKNNFSHFKNRKINILFKKVVKSFYASMDDDFDTPRAVRALLSFIEKINKHNLERLDRYETLKIYSFLSDFNKIFKLVSSKDMVVKIFD